MKGNRFSYRSLQWLVAAFALLHNLEEALAMPAYGPVVRQRLSGLAPAPGVVTAAGIVKVPCP